MLLAVGFNDGIDAGAFAAELENEETATSIEMALESIPAPEWPAISMVGALLLPSIDRWPVGAEVWTQVRSAEEEAADYD